VGGLWGTPAALVMNGGVTLALEAVAAVAVIRGRIRVGSGQGGRPAPAPALVTDDAALTAAE
jgi:hypothetical protein